MTIRMALKHIRAFGSDFDLEVSRGDVIAILGPSGSGKTTAISLLDGAMPMTD